VQPSPFKFLPPGGNRGAIWVPPIQHLKGPVLYATMRRTPLPMRMAHCIIQILRYLTGAILVGVTWRRLHYRPATVRYQHSP
jgi:hypothetical protein